MSYFTSAKKAEEFLIKECEFNADEFLAWSTEEILSAANSYHENLNAQKNKYNDLEKHDDSDPKFITITKIVVPTERDKQQLLKAIEYLHDQNINTDYYAVNTLVNLYEHPDQIEVDNEQ